MPLRQIGKAWNFGFHYCGFESHRGSYAPKVMRFVAPGLYPAILGSTPSGCIVVTIFINVMLIRQAVRHRILIPAFRWFESNMGSILHKRRLSIYCPICRWQMPKEMLKGLRVSYSNKNSKFGITVVAKRQTLEDLVLPAHESVQVRILSAV